MPNSSKDVTTLASNDETEFRKKRDARKDAEKNGVKGRDLEQLKAAEKAAESKLPGGKSGGWGILG
jgi:hypothetical protein